MRVALLVVAVGHDDLRLLATDDLDEPSDGLVERSQDPADARAVLDRAREAQGGVAVDRVAVLETEADCAMRAFLRGHELHALALFPDTRLREPALAGERDFAGRRAWAVRFLDDVGGEVLLHYAADDGLPLGLTTSAHRGDGDVREVTVRFTGCDPPAGDGVRVFRGAEFLVGGEVWTYRFERIDLAAPPERLAVGKP